MRQEPTPDEYRQVLGFVRRRVASAEQAEDIAQEVFASMAEALARSAAAAPRSLGWLYTVARRRIVDEARRRGLKTVPLELAETAPAAYGPELARALDDALSALNDEQRTVVLLRLVRGWSFAEIARELGASEAACRMRFLRGLARLRAELEEGGVAP